MEVEDIDDIELCPECGTKLDIALYVNRLEKDCFHCGTVVIEPIEE